MHPLTLSLLRALDALQPSESHALVAAVQEGRGDRWTSLAVVLARWFDESPDDHDENALVACEGCARHLPLEWTIPDGEGVRLCPTCAPAIADGVDLIAAERRRQMTAEGWTPEHDDAHDGGALALAAATYATPAPHRRMVPRSTSIGGLLDRGDAVWQQPETWPWAPGSWKPCDRVRELVKAGALLAAEIDRIRRAREEHVAAADAAGSRSPSDYEFTGHEQLPVVPGPPSPPDRWVILHVPGRQTYAGRLTDLGHGLFCLAIPEIVAPRSGRVPEHVVPSWSFTFGPPAVFQMIDIDEEIAVGMTRTHARPAPAPWRRPDPLPIEPDEHGHRFDAEYAICLNGDCVARSGRRSALKSCPAIPGPGESSCVVEPDEVGPDGHCTDPDCDRSVGEWHSAGCATEIPF